MSGYRQAAGCLKLPTKSVMKSALRLRLAFPTLSQQKQSGGLRNKDELLRVCTLSPAFTVSEQENRVTYKMPENKSFLNCKDRWGCAEPRLDKNRKQMRELDSDSIHYWTCRVRIEGLRSGFQFYSWSLLTTVLLLQSRIWVLQWISPGEIPWPGVDFFVCNRRFPTYSQSLKTKEIRRIN